MKVLATKEYVHVNWIRKSYGYTLQLFYHLDKFNLVFINFKIYNEMVSAIELKCCCMVFLIFVQGDLNNAIAKWIDEYD